MARIDEPDVAAGPGDLDPSEDAALMVDPRLLQDLEEYCAALEREERPDREPLVAKYGGIAEELEACLNGLEAVHRFAPQLQAHSKRATPRTADLDAPPDRQTLGDFRILREVGRGGMGVVYEAEQISLKRRVALKVFPFAAVLDPRHLQRFKNEAQAAASLDHPNIVAVYSVGCERGVHYFAMQYVEGQTLAAMIRELRQAPQDELEGLRGSTRSLLSGRSAPAEAPRVDSATDSVRPEAGSRPAHDETRCLSRASASTSASAPGREFFRAVAQLGVQAAEALEHAHQMGVVHRDVKPSNLMVDASGRLWVTDFGLAMTHTETNLTMTGDVLGTLRYMSPEQVEGNRRVLDHRTDVYSLGVTLYEFLTLQPAFPGDDRRRLFRRLIDEEPRPPRQLNRTIPNDLETIVLKAMAKEPRQRYATAQELADDLKRFLEYRPIRASRPSPVERLAKWSRRHLALVWMAVVFPTLLAIGLAVSVVLIAKANHDKTNALRQEREQRETADGLRAEAQDREAVLREHLYAADVKLAYKAWQNADPDLTVSLLSRHRPSPGQKDLRGFEWRYLWRLCHPECRTLRGHTGDVFCLAYSPDGRTIASASLDGTVRLWDVAGETLRRTLEGHEGEVNHVAFSPDGAWLASASDDATVRIWEAETGRCMATLRAHTEDVFGVAFSPDGSLLASGGCDDTVKLWDTAGFDEKATLRGHADVVESLAFSPDGKTLATAGDDNTVRLWDPATGEQRSQIEHGNWVTCVAFSHDGRKLATVCKDGVVRLWSADGRREASSLKGHNERIYSVSFSPDDRLLVSSDKDGKALVWDVRTGTIVAILRGHAGRIWSARFSPDGAVLATAGSDGDVKLWEPDASRRFLPVHGRGVHRVSLSPDRRLLTFVPGQIEQKVWDLATGQGETVDRWGHPSHCSCLVLSGDGRTAAAGDCGSTVYLIRMGTGEPGEVLGGHEEDNVSHLVFSRDGRKLASAAGRTVRLWDVAGRRLEHVFPEHDAVGSLDFSADGRTLAAGFCDGVIRFRSAKSPAHPTTLGSHSGGVSSVAFSPDGQTLATAGVDRTIRIWDYRKRHLLATLSGHTNEVTSLAFTPDGMTLASGSRGATVRLWHVLTSQEVCRLKAHSGPVLTLAFTPDGELLVSGGASTEEASEVYLWPTSETGMGD